MEKLHGIDSLASLDFDTLDQMRADAYNRTPGNLTGFDCPDCLNRGNIMHVENHIARLTECHCMERRRSLARIKKSGLAEVIERYTLDTYQTPALWQKRAKQMAMHFIENCAGKWFCVLGSVGSGKTHLCTAICVALLERDFGVRYMRWREESVLLKAMVNEPEEYSRLLNPLKAANVLYIDDLFKGKQVKKTYEDNIASKGDINLAFDLLDYRYSRNLITIISSEHTIDMLMKIDLAIGSRIYERSKDYCLSLFGSDKNWRLNH